MIQQDQDRRRALAAARAKVRELERPDIEARKIAAKQAKRRRPPRESRVDHQRTKPKGGRETDPGFMSWQHESAIGCIACEIEGQPGAATLQGERNPIEVAHQRVSGWKKGVRGHDRDSCVLCRWHHQMAPNACDKGQRQFWERLGVDAAEYCTALYQAFRANADGVEVFRRFANRARTA